MKKRIEKTKMEQNRVKQFSGIAIPAILESIVGVLITSIDTKMISPLGKGAISAVSITTQPKLLFLAIFYALGTASSIFVSQAMGRNNRDEANEYFHTILRICVFLSVIIGAGLALFASPVMRLFSSQFETMAESVSFFRIIMGFILFQNVSIVLNAALRGIGETKVTFISSIFMGVFDILVNYLLIEGHWGFPAMGVSGDAIGTVSGMAASCAVSIFFLIRHSDFLSLKGIVKKSTTRQNTLQNICSKVGNLIFENMFTRIGFLISSIIISGLNADATAVYFVTMILLNYTFAFGDGLQSAVVSLIGRSLGAGDLNEIRVYLRMGRVIGSMVSVCLSAVYILGAHCFFGLYFSDTDSILRGTQYSYVAAILTVMQILRIVNIAAMRGVGEVKIPRTLASISVLIINPTVSFLLTKIFTFGVWGIWIASLLSQGIWCLMSFIKGDSCIRSIVSNADGWA